MKKIITGILAAATACGISFMPAGSIPPVSAEISTVYGDINGDGTVNILDTMRLKQNIVSGKKDFAVTNWRAASGQKGGDIPSASAIGHINEMLLTVGRHENSDINIEPHNGIDVSRWQEVIDWQKVKAAGVEFAMIKAGEGTQTEPTFLRNIKGAKEAGIQCGIYWFNSARTVEDVEAEIQACIETISPYQLEYPVAYDFEYRCFWDLEKDPLANDPQLCTDIIYRFLEGIEEAGYYPILYSNKGFPARYLCKSDLTDRFDFWYANYNLTEPDEYCGIWQRSCKGRIDGISADVDLDVSYVDYRTIMKTYHLNGF